MYSVEYTRKSDGHKMTSDATWPTEDEARKAAQDGTNDQWTARAILTGTGVGEHEHSGPYEGTSNKGDVHRCSTCSKQYVKKFDDVPWTHKSFRK